MTRRRRAAFKDRSGGGGDALAGFFLLPGLGLCVLGIMAMIMIACTRVHYDVVDVGRGLVVGRGEIGGAGFGRVCCRPMGDKGKGVKKRVVVSGHKCIHVCKYINVCGWMECLICLWSLKYLPSPT